MITSVVKKLANTQQFHEEFYDFPLSQVDVMYAGRCSILGRKRLSPLSASAHAYRDHSMMLSHIPN